MNAFAPGFADDPQRSDVTADSAATASPPAVPGFISTTSAAPDEAAFSPPLIPLGDPPLRVAGALTWITCGLALLIVGSVVLSMAGFVVDQMARSQALGVVTLVVFLIAVATILWGVLVEARAYRRLTVVDGMRTRLRDPACDLEDARSACKTWIDSVADRLPDSVSVNAALQACRTTRIPEQNPGSVAGPVV